MAVDDLTIVAGQKQIGGWTSVRVTRGIERLPSDFSIELTEFYPGDNSNVVISPGEPCQIFLGSDLVLTGYVDNYLPTIDGKNHVINITGRSKCQDLVDCSAEYPNSQIGNSTALQIIQNLASPYGITVAQINGGPWNTPQFNLMFGESVVEVIERICRNAQLLFYDGTDGNLILSQIGAGNAASGFTQGINVEKATGNFSMSQRYSEYDVVRQSLYTLSDLGEGSNLIYADKSDIYVGRNRKKILVSEAGDAGFNITKQRAIWEAKRRFGKSFGVTVETDSWRDSSGKLWTPNTIAHVSIPAVKIPNADWVIGDVTYSRDGSGTKATLNLYPPTAFSLEPILLQPIALPELALPQSLQTSGNAPVATNKINL